MCNSCDQCFDEEQKTKLKNKGWSDEEINFAEGSIIEDKIKGMI